MMVQDIHKNNSPNNNNSALIIHDDNDGRHNNDDFDDAGFDECEQECDSMGDCARPQACLCDCCGHSQCHPSPGPAQRL